MTMACKLEIEWYNEAERIMNMILDNIALQSNRIWIAETPAKEAME